MTRRKTNATSPNGADPATFAELVGLTTDHEYNPWDGVDLNTLGQLVEWVSRGGGLCSLGCADDGNSIYVSVRLGEQRKSFQFDTADQFNQWAARVADQWALRWRTQQLAKSPPDTPVKK